MKTLLIFSLLLGVISCGKNSSSSSSSPGPERERPEVTDETFEAEYIKLLNNYRVSLGLRKLVYVKRIEEVANEHSLYMAGGRGRFGHRGWKGRCSKLMQELHGESCSEIVAMGQTTPLDVLNAWLSSRTHRRMLENPQFTHTGLGIRKNGQGIHYWTQLLLER